MGCCDNRFVTFTFEEIREASPPKKKGVYAIRIKARGTPTARMIEESAKLVNKLMWAKVEKYIMSRISRLKEIGDCPVIYVGSAGTRSKSKHTLQGRWQDFCIRHTAMYPLWTLIYYGWDSEFGWLVETRDPEKLENPLKQEYRRDHSGKLPALVAR